MSQGEEKARSLVAPRRNDRPRRKHQGLPGRGNDGQADKVSWASYGPGESYLVVNLLHHIREAHHVVPAAAVERISTGDRVVLLRLTRAQVEAAPKHQDPPAPLDHRMLDAIRSASEQAGVSPRDCPRRGLSLQPHRSAIRFQGQSPFGDSPLKCRKRGAATGATA